MIYRRSRPGTVGGFLVDIDNREALYRAMEDDRGGRTVIEHYPAVERESNGTFSAWLAGLPGVHAATDTVAAKRAIRPALAAHLDALSALGQNVKRRAVERP